MAPQDRLDTTRLQRMARAYCESATLFAAIDLDLFTAIADHPEADLASLAGHLGISELNCERLVTVCLGLGLLDLDGESLINAPDVDRFLVSSSDRFAGPWMQFTRPSVGGWMKLTELLQSDAPIKRLGNYEKLTVDGARRYHRATYSIGMGAGRRFCHHVDLSGRRRLLDIGGGSGAYSINAVKSFDGLEAIVFDLPQVVPVTAEFIAQNDVSERVATAGGDFTTDPFPTGCDVAVMASNLPQYDAEIIGGVVAKTFDALEPGGEFHLVGEMLEADRRGPLDAALWGMEELLAGSGGRAHSAAECVGYLQAAGFVDVEDNEFVPGILRRVTGRKP